jgi:hypothetical protein
MLSARKDFAIIALCIVLGVVILQRACVLGLSPRAAEGFSHTGLPDLIRLVLACSEAAAALLFLAPGTLGVGSWSLLVVFVGAIGMHVAHGEFNVGGLLVYAAAVLVVLTHLQPQRQAIGPVRREEESP